MLSSGKFLSWVENSSPQSNYTELDIVLLLYCRICYPHSCRFLRRNQSREYFHMPKCTLSQAAFKRWSKFKKCGLCKSKNVKLRRSWRKKERRSAMVRKDQKKEHLTKRNCASHHVLCFRHFIFEKQQH